MPLCPGLYRGRTSLCSHCPSLCDHWVWVVVTGPVWQIDHDESQGWKPGSVTAGPGQRWRRPSETESTVDCPGPGAHEPLLCPGALPASVILPANPIPDQRPRRKKATWRERRQRSEKGEGDWRVCWGEGGREQQTTLYLTGEAAARAGAPVCLLPPRLMPSSALVPASARPMKSCHGNTPGPQSEINNLSTSSEEGNL